MYVILSAISIKLLIELNTKQEYNKQENKRDRERESTFVTALGLHWSVDRVIFY